jgi:hypothetical protein
MPAQLSAALVVGTTTLNDGDSSVRDRLIAGGYSVRIVDDSDASSVVADDLVVISSSVSSRTVAGTYRTVPVPVLTYKPWIYSDMALAGTYGNVSGAAIVIQSASSPLAVGLAGGVTLTGSSGAFGWGRPSSSAEVIATASGEPTYFVYESGDALIDGTLAASCRAALPFSHQTFDSATASAIRLLDAVIAWAATC